MPVCANKASNGSVSADQGLSTTSEDRRHPWHVVTMPTPIPLFSASAKPIFKTDCTN